MFNQVIMRSVIFVSAAAAWTSFADHRLLPSIKHLEKTNLNPIQRRIANDLNRLLSVPAPPRKVLSIKSKFELLQNKFQLSVQPSRHDFKGEEVLKGTCTMRLSPMQSFVKQIKVSVTPRDNREPSIRILPHGEKYNFQMVTPLEKSYPADLPLADIFKHQFKNNYIYSYKEPGSPPRTHTYRIRVLPHTDLVGAHYRVFITEQICMDEEGCGDGKTEERDAINYGDPIQYCIFSK